MYRYAKYVRYVQPSVVEDMLQKINCMSSAEERKRIMKKHAPLTCFFYVFSLI